jgi:hypothetical protein
VPFGCTIGVFLLAFYGLAYSLFPYLVVDRITIWQAASAPEALKIILVGGRRAADHRGLHHLQLSGVRAAKRGNSLTSKVGG